MSNPAVGYTICIGCALLVIAAIYGLYRETRAILYDRREARHTPSAIREARKAETYTGLLREPGPPWEEIQLADAGRAAATERLTEAFSQVAAGQLQTGTGAFPMLDPDPAPDPTLIQPHDVKYLGMPTGEFVALKFAEADAALEDAWKEPIP